MFKSYICTSCVIEETQRRNGVLLHTVSKIVTVFEISAHIICGMMSALQFLSRRTAVAALTIRDIGTPRVYLNQILINKEHLTFGLGTCNVQDETRSERVLQRRL